MPNGMYVSDRISAFANSGLSPERTEALGHNWLLGRHSCTWVQPSSAMGALLDEGECHNMQIDRNTDLRTETGITENTPSR